MKAHWFKLLWRPIGLKLLWRPNSIKLLWRPVSLKPTTASKLSISSTFSWELLQMTELCEHRTDWWTLWHKDVSLAQLDWTKDRWQKAKIDEMRKLANGDSSGKGRPLQREKQGSIVKNEVRPPPPPPPCDFDNMAAGANYDFLKQPRTDAKHHC